MFNTDVTLQLMLDRLKALENKVDEMSSIINTNSNTSKKNTSYEDYGRSSKPIDHTQIQSIRESNINDAIKDFDWDRVRTVMLQLNWEWAFGECYKVPTITDMTDYVRSSLRRCYDMMDYESSETYMVSSGGFRTTVYNDNSCVIEFILTYSTGGDEF